MLPYGYAFYVLFLVGSLNSGCPLLVVFCPRQLDITLCTTRKPLFGLLFKSDSRVPYWVRNWIPYLVIIASFGLPFVGKVSPILLGLFPNSYVSRD
jgi:hypothetical protein